MTRHYRVSFIIAAGLAIGVGMAQGLFAQTSAPSDPHSASGQHSASSDPVKRTVLVRTDLEGMEGKEAVLFLAELAPSAAGGKHFHPGTELFYVIEGTFIHEPEGSQPITLAAGQAAYNPFRSVHIVRNASATTPTRVLGCLVTEKGQPLSVSTK